MLAHSFTGLIDERHPPERAPTNWRTVAGEVRTTHGYEFCERPIAVVSSGRLDRGALAGDVLVALDGYIDNRHQLAATLGLPPEASAELVLAAGYRKWRIDLLEQLRGDFALLAWDRTSRTGLIARDQLGVRSIFLHTAGSRLYFASDLPALLSTLPARPSPDEIALVEYLSLHNLGGTRTMYEGVVELEPAHAILLRPGARESRRYWAPVYGGVLNVERDELTSEIRRVMSAAVERRLARGTPTAVTMSGGLDSTTVAALARGLAPETVSAYSTTMPEFPGEDEAPFIDAMARFTGLPVKTFPTRPRGMVAAGLETLAATGVPAVTTTDFIRRLPLAAAHADGATLVLGGDGGDEVFGPRSELMADLMIRGRLLAALDLARRHPEPGPAPTRLQVLRPTLRFGLRTVRPPILDDLTVRIAGPSRYATAWLRPEHARRAFQAREETTWKRASGPRWWARLADTLTRNHARVGLFLETRQIAQREGLDQRHPLLDFELIELALQLPPESSFSNEGSRSLNRPQLREVMCGLLPEEVRLRARKTNFVPLALTALLAEREVVERLLRAPTAEILRYVQPARMIDLLEGRQHDGRLNQHWLDSVWRLFMAECWLHEQADPGSTSALLERAQEGPSSLFPPCPPASYPPTLATA